MINSFRRRSALLMGVLLLVTSSACAENRSPSDPPDFTRAMELADKAVKSPLIASISIAAAKDGKIVLEYSTGMADVAEGVKATPETAYSLASMRVPHFGQSMGSFE